MNIAIFSGSFNPIHIGHLILGNYMTEFVGVDEVWYLVTPENPLKQKSDLLDEQERLEMTQLALAGYPKLHASNFEFSLPKPNYTLDTLTALQKAYPQHQFSLIIGADNWQIFDKWKNYRQILTDFRVYVYPRLGFPVSILAGYAKTVKQVDAPIIEISSTQIREGLRNHKCVKPLLPTGVDEYLKIKRFYL